MLSLTLPRPTWAHRLPAGAKLAGLLGATLVIFPLTDARVLAGLLAGMAALAVSLGGGAARQLLRSLRPLALLLLVVLGFHLWQDRLDQGLVVALRVLVLVALATLVTMTTRLEDLIAIIERLAAPLHRLGLPPRALGLAVAMVIRFIPVFIDRQSRLTEAWRARSPRRPGVRLLAPLMLSVLDDADHVSDALTARGGLAAPSSSSPEKDPADGT
ncbi:energy-coupling factor transporter transmembrane component T family protein [Pseudooceanicola aestuarii]|uniref:energy-coupling factor transporter transmembrane component T family protein n=1 Tax=Pseudooceanicola aestuarii TaxID=2697319 RepID=UPI0013D6F90A|nr:energy-coupling factor transporter transmembrane protein EcfT [Pseudooceanicola aestuarii]